MCKKCGCNTCGTKIRGPLLTEGRVKKLVSENLQYHIDNNIPLMENVFRIGSDAHLSMIKEAKKLYSRGVLDLCEEDEGLMKTHIGEFDLYENEIVPLDLPMLSEQMDLEEAYSGFIKSDEFDGEYEEEPEVSLRIKGKVSQFKEDVRALFGKFKGDLNNPDFIRGVAQIMVNWKPLLRSQLAEAKKKKKKTKKDPPIGKPKRGGSKAYYVYVRNPKTKKVKKVSFGSGGLRAKIRNPKARKAFAARHNCKNKKDRTKAGYWSCNLPRYASQLGLGANMNTFW